MSTFFSLENRCGLEIPSSLMRWLEANVEEGTKVKVNWVVFFLVYTYSLR